MQTPTHRAYATASRMRPNPLKHLRNMTDLHKAELDSSPDRGRKYRETEIGKWNDPDEEELD